MGLGIGVGFTDAMRGVEKDIAGAIPTDFDIDADIRRTVRDTSAGNIVRQLMEHTGTIRVEGVTDSGALSGVVDIIMGELRREVRV